MIAALAVTVVAAAGAVPTGPAGACGDQGGVTVVVEPGSLGGVPAVRCDPEVAGEVVAETTTDAGFELDYVVGQPFVCRIDGLPAPAAQGCDRIPPDDAYWGLFWSDGESGEWTYAALGVSALEVPDGGFIGWRWQDSPARQAPAVLPTGEAAQVSPADGGGAAPEPASEDEDGWLMLVAGGSMAGLVAAAAAVARRRRGLS